MSRLAIATSGGPECSHVPIRLVETNSGREVGILAGHTDTINTLQYLPPHPLLSAADDGSVKFWDIVAGKCSRTISVVEPNSDYEIRENQKALLSPDGRTLAVTVQMGHWDGGEWPGRLMLYDTRTSRRFFDSDYDEEIGTALSWSPDSGTLAIGKRDLHLVDLRRPIDRSRWRELDTIQRIPDPAAPGNTGTLGICDIQDLAYSPDGRSLAVATETHLVLYDVPGGATRWARVLVLGTAVTFAGTGNWIACTGMGEARILDAGTGESLSEFDIGPVTVTAVARSSDDRLLATGDGNGFVTVWDTGTGSRLCELKALPAHAGFPDITALAFLDES